jgi:hypothetical protein
VVPRSNVTDSLLRLVQPVLRWRYAVLLLAAYGFSLRNTNLGGGDWYLFEHGGPLLLRHGLHFYANYPFYTSGPLSLLAALPFRVIGPGNGRLAVLTMTAVAPLLVFVLEQAAKCLWPAISDRDRAFRHMTVLFGGLMLMWSWVSVATVYAHLDDVLTLTAVVGALWAVAARRHVVLGFALGVAIAAKPWGIVVLPLVFALTGRARWKALAIAAGIACVAWLPFAVADAKTLSVLRPTVGVAPQSVMHLLGAPPGTVTKWTKWTRSVQLGCALVAAGLAVWRGRWAAVPLVAIAIRVALDPAVWPYYTTGVVLAALAWDLLRTRRAFPIWTLSSFVFLDRASTVVRDADAQAGLRLALVVGVVFAVLVIHRRTLVPRSSAIEPS